MLPSRRQPEISLNHKSCQGMIFRRFKSRFIKQSKLLICLLSDLTGHSTQHYSLPTQALVTDLFTCQSVWSKSFWFFSSFQEWTDANMRWNKTEYSDIEDIRIPPARLWKPDILMYNRSVQCQVSIVMARYWSPSLVQTPHMAHMSQLASLVIGWWLVVVLHLLHDPPSKIK